MKRELFLQFLCVFLVTQILGLYVADVLVQSDVSIDLPAGDKDNINNSLFMFAYIMVFTLILLGVIKIAKGKMLYYLLKGLESLAVFTAASIVFATFYDSILVLIPAIALVIARIIWPAKILLRNFATVLAVSGVGALIGVSLGPLPIVVFMVLLAVYDYIAVFKTKHMIKLAKAVSSKNLAFSYAMPTKEHTFELGTGDLVIPLAFAASLLAAVKPFYVFPYYLIPSALVLVASLVGLKLTMDIVAKKVGKALPALPMQVALMVMVYIGVVLMGII